MAQGKLTTHSLWRVPESAQEFAAVKSAAEPLESPAELSTNTSAKSSAIGGAYIDRFETQEACGTGVQRLAGTRFQLIDPHTRRIIAL